jgi:colanic acid biosynthesis glycosyl transferase WcaI
VLCIEPTLLCAPLALLAAKVVGARTVLHVQDLEIDAAFAVGHLTGGWLKALALGFEAITIRRFDRVITISGRMRQRLLAKGVAAERIVVIRNWVDTDHIRPLAGPNRFRRELGVADDAFVALYAGSLGAKQALHIVMDAAERLKDQPGIVFIIAGDGPERARLIGRGLANVRFLPLQPEALLPELLAAADVHLLPQVAGVADLVLPSKLGGMLASGKPLIVQTEPGAELHGFLQGAACITPPGDAEALASAIQARAPDTAERVQLRKALAERLSSAKSLPDLLGVLTS